MFLLPLFFYISQDAYSLPKITLLRVITIIIILSWLIKVFAEKEIKILKTNLYFLLIALTLIIILSTIFSTDILRSLEGAYQRHEGLYTFLNYFTLFFIGANFINNNQKINQILNFTILSSALVSIYGIFQFFGYDFLRPGAKGAISVISTQGNPNFLAAYLILILPISINQFIIGKEDKLRWFYLLSSLLAFFCLIFTSTRAAWLGFLISMIVLVILNRKYLKLSRKVMVIASIVIIFLVFFSLIFFLSFPKNWIAERIKSSFKISEGSVGERIELWKNTLKMIEKKPILGYGLETYDLIYPNFMSKKYQRLAEGRSADRPHSDFLQIAVSMGIIGFLIYFIFLIIFTLSILRYLKLKENAYSSILPGIVAGLLAYFIQLQFSFTVIEVAPLAWLFMGTAVFLGESSESEKGENFIKISWRDFFSRYIYLIIIFFVLLFFFLFWLILKPFVSDIYLRKALESTVNNRIEEAIEYGEKATQLNPRRDRYFTYEGLFYSLGAKNIPQRKEEYYKKGIEAYQKAIKLSPRNSENYASFGKFYLNFDILNEAIFELRKAVNLNFSNLLAVHDLGIAYKRKGWLTDAIMEWDYIVDVSFEHIPSSYYHLGLAYKDIGKKDKAKFYLEKFIEIKGGDQKMLSEAKEALKQL